MDALKIEKTAGAEKAKKAVKSVADIMQAITIAPSPVITRRAPVITAIDLTKVDLKKFRHDYPSSNAGLIALCMSRPSTRHELLGFLIAVYYGGKTENAKKAASRLNGFLANKTPRKGIETTLSEGRYACKA